MKPAHQIAGPVLLLGLGSIVCGVGRTPAGMSISRQSALKSGLELWRKPGAIDGGAACATCHTPDGIEIAAYNFDDNNIRRRAAPHLGLANAEILVQYFHAVRDQFHLYPLRDPNEDRPLQPGGSVLPGATAADRDLAFGKEIQPQLPLLFGKPIETIEQAKAAEAELLAIQPMKLKIGIALNRLSEDIAHGNEHATIAQWLPEVPPLIPVDHTADWYAAEDTYLANPSIDNLKSLLDTHARLVNSSRMMGLAALSALKFRALLVWQDRLRHHSDQTQTNVAADVLKYGNYNPTWEVGEMARQLMGRTPSALGMDAIIQTNKVGAIPIDQQLHDLRLSWFWAGWLSDEGLFKTSHDDKTRLGMWFSQSTSQDGPYPIHNVFANARRQAVATNDLASWGETVERRRRIWDFAGLRSFAFQTKDLPKDPAYRAMTVRFTANCFRMNLLLLKDDMQRNRYVWVKQAARSNVRDLVGFLEAQEPEFGTANQSLLKDLNQLIDSVREINQFGHP